eukprot:scaffold37475_cov44-Attheya_sp.AAC.1
MSIPNTTEEEVFERHWGDGPLIDVEAPVVEGDDLYTAMIRSLLFLVDCRNNEGDRVPLLPSFDVIHQQTANWMENKAHTLKFVEDETLDESLLVFVMRIENPRCMARIWAEMEGHGFLLFRARCVKCHCPRVALVWGSSLEGNHQSHQSV